ncbi:hypothetical protein [Nostoc sp. CALU 1950]|uniref:hypothetical protein n=1 Tax=Nostoc sp. CALU 1950 TaxID=3104321 RepID=UPI003EBA8520
MKNIKDIKKSIGERDSAVQKAEDGAADLKEKVANLAKNLEDIEREYQVCSLCVEFLDIISLVACLIFTLNI